MLASIQRTDQKPHSIHTALVFASWKKRGCTDSTITGDLHSSCRSQNTGHKASLLNYSYIYGQATLILKTLQNTCTGSFNFYYSCKVVQGYSAFPLHFFSPFQGPEILKVKHMVIQIRRNLRQTPVKKKKKKVRFYGTLKCYCMLWNYKSLDSANKRLRKKN